MAIDVDKIVADEKVECDVDQVGLWSIIFRIRYEGILDELERHDLTMVVVSKLLDDVDIVACECRNDHKYHEWLGGKDAIIDRIEKEWRELGREPNIGDIVYFVTRDFFDSQNVIEPVAHNIITECAARFVSIAEIVQRLRSGGLRPDYVEGSTLSIIQSLSGRFAIKPFRFVDGSYTEWEIDNRQLIHMIRQEWQQLGRDPQSTEIVALSTNGEKFISAQ